MRHIKIAISQDDLDDLHERLHRARLPTPMAGLTWEQGVDIDYLRSLLRFWCEEFDWRAYERRLNEYDHLTDESSGERIHLLHVRSSRTDALPLILSHGWPGLFSEFLDVIPLMTEPGEGKQPFHLVIPSLPGFGFSGPVSGPGWDHRRIATAFADIMTDLGYERFGAQGGDLGAWVSSTMAELYPDRVVGLHLNLVNITRPDLEARDGLSEEELAALAGQAEWARRESAYKLLQETKPQTIGFALEDSPAGLAAWLIDKFRAWSDCGGDISTVFSAERLVEHVATYWLTRTATSSMRLYYERANQEVEQRRVEVPTAVANFPGEVVRYPRSWVGRHFNVVRWTNPARGGHFAAMEAPQLFAADVEGFFSTLTPLDR